MGFESSEVAVSSSGATAATLPQILADALPADYQQPCAAPGVRVLLIALRQWQALLPLAEPWLDPAEAARVARKRLAHDRELLTLAYGFHRLWLAHWLDCAPAAVPLIRDARGAPQVPGTRLHTSLSHCDDAIAIAVSAAGPVGVDIESSRRAAGMLELAERICHPRELQVLAGLPERAHGPALLRLWVRKEAVLKAAGVGLMAEMAAIDVSADMSRFSINNINHDLQLVDIEEHGECVATAAIAMNALLQWAWLR